MYSGYVSGIMGDEDNPQEERIDSVVEILSGAVEEVSVRANAFAAAQCSEEDPTACLFSSRKARHQVPPATQGARERS